MSMSEESYYHDSDQDPEYCVESDSSGSGYSSSFSELSNIKSNVSGTVESTIVANNDGNEDGICANDSDTTGRTRKRLRRVNTWKRNVISNMRNSGQSYIDNKGTHHKGKSLQSIDNHSCRYQCSTFSMADRSKIFDDYWKLGSWNLQTSFVLSIVEFFPVKRHRTNAIRKKNLVVHLKLMGKRVCKEFLLKTLCISQKRYDNILKKRKESGVSGTDMRGKHTPSNKIANSRVELIKQHIPCFPKFQSHYSREYNSHCLYLSPDLNVRKMYELYKEFCEEKHETPVKESYYRNIFNTQFNLRFKLPYTDTCMKCDKLENKIKNDSNVEEVNQSIIQKENHLRQAEMAKIAKNDAKQIAKTNSEEVRAICFDLEKTLPTPMLSTSVVYYTRQLWTYNFDIHDLGTNKASMYMWHEGEGGRGSQEIGSCLLHYAKTLPSSIKHLFAFSDNCGGQNKNNNIIKFWMYIICTTNIELIDHKFLISGHSYMECDQDFGIIEKSKKRTQYVFVPEDWENVVKAASRNFKIVRMENKSFKSIDNFHKVVSNKSIKGIRSMQWIRIEKSSPYTLLYKTSLNSEEPFQTIDLKQKKQGRPTSGSSIKLDALYKDSLPIKSAKYKDLQKLMDYLPPINHKFYKSLKHSCGTTINTEDDLEAEEEYEGDYLSDCESD